MRIDGYEFGRIVIDGQEHRSDLLLFPDGRLETSWRRRTGHQLILDDLEALLKSQPEVLVAGTGASGLMQVHAEVVTAMERQGISFYALPTKQAVDLYHRLVEEGRRVAACLHLTC